MAHLAMLLLTYAALVVQVVQRDALAVRGISPDFVCIVLLAAAFWLNGASAVAWGAVAGLLADCCGSTQLGIRMLFATLLVAGVQICLGTEWRRSAIVQAILGCAIVCFYLTGTEVAHLVLDRQPIFFPRIWPPIVATAVYTSVVGIGLRAIWKLSTRFAPTRSADAAPVATGRWDALNRSRL